MKKNLLLLCVLFLPLLVNSQIRTNAEGKYITKNDSLYSGVIRTWYENGAKKMEVNILEGLNNGKTFLYFEDGRLNEIRSYTAGKMDGIWELYNNEGIKTAEASYLNNVKDGKWTIWDDKGVLRYEMFYSEGKKAGIWIMYNESGVKVAEKVY